ncbi:uncharacterized protein I303_104166 [Kwoniella dejecticola CBS 10117]|uniref:RNA polymerase II assembly factor Rtp1 C-terminal domain-containing protein n=1 Tax=Kwoniella dejecticola CBS 10117 TaxID=1296121 RepID=A0A1A6A639_9TREE|nr:uncharacterized protein I303_04856 [Kwoniella dejecticola CBS 10117]OBR85520.1 hypothetical protein I303_04856 [Kwoniella dejecticola CBS 10117]
MPPRQSSTGSPTLKNLLKSSDLLLKPPTPLSSNPVDLIQRLKACSRSLPKEWRKNTPEWCAEDETEQIGDNDPSVDDERRKRRRDELVFVVGKRCFALIKAMQMILEKEFWPKESLQDELAPNDFLLGTADLRLIRLMLSHTTFSYILPLASHYADSLPTILPKTAESLAQALEALLKLLKTSAPPVPAAGPSSRTPTPPTSITQTLLSSHLIPIFLSTLILAYTPTTPGETYATLRSQFVSALTSLSPGHAISTLVNVLKLLVQGTKEGVKPNGWVREWPKYPKEIINGLLTAQVRRPGGVRGLMENVLGETAKTDDVTSIEGQRLDHIFNVLIRIPRQVTPEIYYPWLLSELFAMIPLTSHSHLPVAYVNTACYCIQRLWASNRPLIGDWLKNKIHSPWRPTFTSTSTSVAEPMVATTSEAIHRSVQNMRLLLLHNPTSHEFANFLVGSVLPPLFSLHSYLSSQAPNPQISEAKTPEDAANSLKDGVQSLLISWGKAVDEIDGVRGIWSIVEGEGGWGKVIDGESSLYWEKDVEGVKLVVSRNSGQHPEPQVILPSIASNSLNDEERLNQLLKQKHTSPDPQLLCRLIGSFDRPDIASEVILKSLDSWRIKLSTELEPSVESLANLQLTIQMMEKLGSQLFSKPSQVLGFVERVLNDQVQSLEEELPREMEDKKPFIAELIGDDDDQTGLDDEIAPDGKRGLIEVACQLLASLEGEGQLQDYTPILQPIISHLDILAQKSPSVSIRNAAREAQLLLSQRSDPQIIEQSNPQQTWMESFKQALALVKDDTLPVKAHGLTLLRDLVVSPSFDNSFTSNILSVYLAHLDDKDSFIYLTAIKGLSGMVDALGDDLFYALIGRYMEEVLKVQQKKNPGDVTSRMERVSRLAEAIDQVIERSADTLGQHGGKIVPPLMSIYPNNILPTVLRSSALSILSTCARVAPYSILPWAGDLASSTLDLIQLESVQSSPFKPTPEHIAPEENHAKTQWGKSKLVQLVDDEPIVLTEDVEVPPKPEKPRIVDDDPIRRGDGKHPTLRRAALSVFNWSIRVILFVRFLSSASGEEQQSIDESNIRLPSNHSPITVRSSAEDTEEFSQEFLDRASTIVGYVAQFDDDEIVRQHAQSALKDLQLLKKGGLDFGESEDGIKALEGIRSLRIK